ncbi:snustorr snarlik isoform 1-T3 [Cochliomyia hominivorax]
MLQSSSSTLSSASSIKCQRSAVVSCCLVLLLFLGPLQQSAALIVPNELPSILSLVYSNIPPIKKGTDSRLGFGFRLGEHADFQVLLELGPQKETRPIGDTEDSDGSSFNKRQVNKRHQLRVQHEMSTTTERPAATWLEKWSNDANNPSKKQFSKPSLVKKPIANKPVEMPTMPQLSDQTLRQLQMLYKMAATSTSDNLATSTESDPITGNIDAARHLQERLKTFKAPANLEELQNLRQKSSTKTKTEITKELMDVNLD